MSDKLGIVVAKQKDFAALKARFRNAFPILKLDGPSGPTVNTADMIAAARKQIKMLMSIDGSSEILLLIDCDSRRSSYRTLLRELTLRAGAMNVRTPIHISIPNRTIENWYLADIEYLSRRKKRLLKGNIRQRDYEGKNGRIELKKLFRKSVTYDEVRHGAEMFMVIRTRVARANSSSFDTFYSVIERFL
jgi:hypothetical protein